MDTSTARRLFTAEPVARLATAGADGRPHLVPVTFAVIPVDADGDPGAQDGAGTSAPTGGDGSVVVFAVDGKPKRSTRLRRLANIAANPHVAFLTDRYHADWAALWWVRADALARIVPDPADARHRRAVNALIEKYPQYRLEPPTGPVVWSAVTRWSGWSASEGAGGPVTPRR
jgi:PPOX class probable F420-dependent enzyme